MNKSPKILAFYLPQFHIIEENNEWWGQGFTEWTNVKKASPLFKGHYQPRVPLDSNYYDLLDNDSQVMKNQAKLARTNGIDAFCFYHYWFGGKLLLQEPLENLLKSKDIDIDYCFSWANEPWARTWDGRNSDILMPQEYGDEEEWNLHFKYLLNFFKDERYIKINHKPMLVIYRLSHIPNYERMIEYWDNLCKINGFSGIHIVETLNSREKEPISNLSKSAVEFEPSYTLHHKYDFKYRVKDWVKKKIRGINIQSYDDIYNCIIKRNYVPKDKTIYIGAFVAWDNSPRKGKKALIVKGSTPNKFYHYLKQIYSKAVDNSIDFIFINAWNEWAEGAFLEPDELYGNEYLRAVRCVKDGSPF